MPDSFLALPLGERAEALAVAATRSGRPADLLEKDVWVVWALDALFRSAFGDALCFKGGTSLSKAYRVISRFSEDVDVTYDIRALLPDVTVGETGEPVPASRSQEARWSARVREALPAWVAATALPLLVDRLADEEAPAQARADGDRIFLRYEAAAPGTADYVRPEVMIEFGARSTGEPVRRVPVDCDAAAHLPMLAFPTAVPRVMAAERTFWEKATAIHVFCLSERLRGERYARHWYDLVRLDDHGVADAALADRTLGGAVALHKRWFFRVKDAAGTDVDYGAAVDGRLRLVPGEAGLALLRDDYGRMVQAGLLEEAAPPFDALMARCQALEVRANG